VRCRGWTAARSARSCWPTANIGASPSSWFTGTNAAVMPDVGGFVRKGTPDLLLDMVDHTAAPVLSDDK
jgi:hypothetical protein